MATATSAQATAPGDDGEHKVWICHATNSDTNPYEAIHVDVASKKYEGHLAHRNSPNKIWKEAGSWNGTSHEADQAKPDLIEGMNFEGDPRTGDSKFCGDRGVVECPDDERVSSNSSDDCDEEDEIEVVAVITYVEPTCDDHTVDWSGRATVDGDEADDDLVTFEVTDGTPGPGETIEITATIHDDDYEFDNEDTEETFEHTFKDVPTNCSTVIDVPAAPAVTDPCGANNIAFVLPADTAQLNWEPGAAGSVVVTPIAPAVFAGGEQSKTFTLPAEGNVASCEAAPPAVAPPGEVAGTESVAPKPSKKPAVKPNKTSKPQVLGTEAAVPTAVDAGLGSLPAAAPAPGSLLGQLLAGAGVALMLAAGWLMTAGRRKVGAREA